MTTRILLRGGLVADGIAATARRADVLIEDGVITGRLLQNVAVLASQGTIRHNIAGLAAGPLGTSELAAARREVESALTDGAVGLSSGMDYVPSRFGAAGEVADLARPLAAAGRPYVSHL